MPNRTNDRRTVAAPIGAEALPPLPEPAGVLELIVVDCSLSRLVSGYTADQYRQGQRNAIAPHVERIRVLERELAEFHQAVEDAKQAVETHRAESADIPDWRVGEFWSSANPSKKVLMLAEGAKQIEGYRQHHDFIRWVDGRTAGTAPTAPPVAWAVTAARGGIHKLSIARESAERKAAAWRDEWPNNGCRVRPLIFGDLAAAPSSLSGTEVANG